MCKLDFLVRLAPQGRPRTHVAVRLWSLWGSLGLHHPVGQAFYLYPVILHEMGHCNLAGEWRELLGAMGINKNGAAMRKSPNGVGRPIGWQADNWWRVSLCSHLQGLKLEPDPFWDPTSPDSSKIWMILAPKTHNVWFWHCFLMDPTEPCFIDGSWNQEPSPARPRSKRKPSKFGQQFCSLLSFTFGKCQPQWQATTLIAKPVALWSNLSTMVWAPGSLE